MNNSTSFFFDPLDNESIDPKSDIDIDMQLELGAHVSNLCRLAFSMIDNSY